MSHKRLPITAAAISLIAAIIACNTPGGVSPTVTMPPIDLPTSIPGGILTPTPQAATAGPVIQPTATMIPTQPQQPTKPPTAVPAPRGKRVSFQTGATQAEVNPGLAAGASDDYVLGVAAGQVIIVNSVNPTDLKITISAANGTALATGTGAVRAVAPSTQDYLVHVTAGVGGTYTIRFVVPQKISFGAGATWSLASGTIQPNARFHWSINLQAGQALEVHGSAGSGYGITVSGLDGNTLPGGSTTPPFFRGKVPATGDYVITVTGGSAATSYDLTVIAPARISFAAGASSATRNGHLNPHEVIHYVIAASKDQTMDLAFAPANTGEMTIYGADGTVLWSGMGEGTAWNGKLPLTQDYFIVFTAGDKAVDYSLSVSVH